LGHPASVFVAADLACEVHALDHEAEETVELDNVSMVRRKGGEEGLASNGVQSWERSLVLRIDGMIAVGGLCMFLRVDLWKLK